MSRSRNTQRYRDAKAFRYVSGVRPPILSRVLLYGHGCSDCGSGRCDWCESNDRRRDIRRAYESVRDLLAETFESEPWDYHWLGLGCDCFEACDCATVGRHWRGPCPWCGGATTETDDGALRTVFPCCPKYLAPWPSEATFTLGERVASTRWQ